MTHDASSIHTPLRRPVFHILLALSNGRHHGLAIADSVLEETAGQIRLGPGTLYRSLKDMAEAGLVVQVPAAADDPRRKVYEITPLGQELLRGEAERLAHVVEIARTRNVLER